MQGPLQQAQGRLSTRAPALAGDDKFMELVEASVRLFLLSVLFQQYGRSQQNPDGKPCTEGD